MLTFFTGDLPKAGMMKDLNFKSALETFLF